MSSPSHKLIVKPNGNSAKVRKYHVVSHMGPTHNLGVYNNNVRSVERALLERYFLCETDKGFEPALRVRANAYNTVELTQFRQGVVDSTKPDATVLTLSEVVDCYTGAKRARYETAHRSLLRKSYTTEDAKLASFTKFEKQDLTKASRVINPRSSRYNLILGKYLKKAEKPIFKAINKMWGEHTPHTIIKGLDCVESATVAHAKWARFKKPVGVGLDAKKFDMHVSRPALKYEHMFYIMMFGTPELCELLRQQLQNSGKAYCDDGTVEFSMPGTRSSGDLNTSLGNCIIMCAAIWAMCKRLGIDAELMNNGDDCVVIMESDDLSRFMEDVEPWFTSIGFRMTVEPPVYEFEQIEFCQTQPVCVNGVWRMVRNPFTCMKKDPMCLIPLASNKAYQKWLHAVGNCGASLVPGVPVMQSFYHCFLRHGRDGGARFGNHVFKNTGKTDCVPTVRSERVAVEPATRASFHKAFGLTPEAQICLETYYDNLTLRNKLEGKCSLSELDTRAPSFIAMAPLLKSW